MTIPTDTFDWASVQTNILASGGLVPNKQAPVAEDPEHDFVAEGSISKVRTPLQYFNYQLSGIGEYSRYIRNWFIPGDVYRAQEDRSRFNAGARLGGEWDYLGSKSYTLDGNLISTYYWKKIS